MRIEILPEARDDLIAGFRFYERQAPGLGSHFRESVLKDVDSLVVHGGVHPKVFGYHRSLSKRFPFAFIIGSRRMWFASAQFWTAAEILLGLDDAFGAHNCPGLRTILRADPPPVLGRVKRPNPLISDSRLLREDASRVEWFSRPEVTRNLCFSIDELGLRHRHC